MQNTDIFSDLSSSSHSSESKKNKIKNAKMSTSFTKLHNQNNKCRNPMSCGKLSVVSIDSTAKKVQNSFRNFLSRYKFKKTQKEDKKKLFAVFKTLQKQLAKNDYRCLIDGGNDSNFFGSLLYLQKQRVQQQAQHIYQALYLHLQKLE